MYIKAYSRRASVRISLGRLEDAKRDFEKILKLEPTNRFAKSELEKLEEVCQVTALHGTSFVKFSSTSKLNNSQ